MEIPPPPPLPKINKKFSKNMAIAIVLIVILSVVLVGAIALNHPPANSNTVTPSPSPTKSTPTQAPPTVTPGVSNLEQPNIVTTPAGYSTDFSYTSDPQRLFRAEFNLTNIGNSPAYNITISVTANDIDGVPKINTTLIVADKMMANESLHYYGVIYFSDPSGRTDIDQNSVLFSTHYSASPPTNLIPEIIDILSVQVGTEVGSKVTVFLQNTGNTNVTLVNCVYRDVSGKTMDISMPLHPFLLTANSPQTSLNFSRLSSGNYTITLISQNGNSFTTPTYYVPAT